jgi:hypothetical protein
MDESVVPGARWHWISLGDSFGQPTRISLQEKTSFAVVRDPQAGDPLNSAYRSTPIETLVHETSLRTCSYRWFGMSFDFSAGLGGAGSYPDSSHLIGLNVPAPRRRTQAHLWVVRCIQHARQKLDQGGLGLRLWQGHRYQPFLGVPRFMGTRFPESSSAGLPLIACLTRLQVVVVTPGTSHSFSSYLPDTVRSLRGRPSSQVTCDE